jgi:DNA-binding Xre family transcriptional regulator
MRSRRRQYTENRKQKLGLDEFRRREREKRAFQNHRAGKKKHSARTSPGLEPKVDRLPIVNFLLKELKRRGWTKNELANRSGIDASRLDRIIAGEEKSKKVKSGVVKINKITWDNVDRILWGLDQEQMLTIMYSDDEVVNDDD